VVSFRGLDLAEPQRAPLPDNAVARHLFAVDRLLLAYVAVVSAVALARLASFPDCRWLLLANGLIVVLVLLVTRPDQGPFGRVVHDVYPIILLLALYASLDILNGGGRVAVHDATIQRWEQALFGGQPSRDWWRAAPSGVWSTVLHGAYFSYYFVIVAPTVALLRSADRGPLRRFVLAVMVTFVACYLAFIFFPVAGPYYAFPRPSGPFVDNAAAQLVYRVLAQGSSFGAAFPSSHVAASVAATVVTWTVSRWLGVILAVATALLTVGVVYCQMHYAVDALAGLVVGLTVGFGVKYVNLNSKNR
jgi:membrane-associated phospholipid phosphatase